MSTLNIYINDREPNDYKIATFNYKDEKAYPWHTCHNEHEVLDKVKDFLSKNKIENKPYTGDILFVSKAPMWFTPNKIYHIQDGIIKDNTGGTFPYFNDLPLISFKDVKEYFSKTGRRTCKNIRFNDESYEIIEVVP